MTLPLIYLLSKSSMLEKRKIINIVKRHNTNEEKVQWLIAQVKASGGLDYTKTKMLEYKGKSITLLHELPDNPSRESLISLIEYITSRDK